MTKTVIQDTHSGTASSDVLGGVSSTQNPTLSFARKITQQEEGKDSLSKTWGF